MSLSSFGPVMFADHCILESLVFALIGADVIAPSEIAKACRRTAEDALPGDGSARLLAFAKSLEDAEAGAECGPAPRWTPEVVPGGKAGGGQNGCLLWSVPCHLTFDT